jgi:hypothetical protein
MSVQGTSRSAAHDRQLFGSAAPAGGVETDAALPQAEAAPER